MIDSQAALYCTLHSGLRVFGVPVLHMKEVTTETRVTPIPHAPDVIVGYVNIRGQIILALELRRLLGWDTSITSASDSTPSCLVIFKPSIGPQMGLMVDRVGEVVSILPEQQEPYRPSLDNQPGQQTRSELIAAIGKLEGQLIVLLDTPKFLPLVESLVSQSALHDYSSNGSETTNTSSI
jgi:purine-binding chemotaxis protein CheW